MRKKLKVKASIPASLTDEEKELVKKELMSEHIKKISIEKGEKPPLIATKQRIREFQEINPPIQ